MAGADSFTQDHCAMSSITKQCPACGQNLRAGQHDWHLVCPSCSYEGSSLQVDIDVVGDHEVLDEALRQEGLSDLRQANFRLLSKKIAASVSVLPGERKPRLLDVGCAHGWFIQATEKAFSSQGIEPDARIADVAASKGLKVRKGFFPDVLDQDERFDVISFNDVMEHIPDVNAAFNACARHLTPGGRVVINAPARTGTLYQISKLLDRLGLPSSFERMWQKDFPSPHIHYFDDNSIEAIGEKAGLTLEKISTLPSLSTNGLYARIRYDRNIPAWKAWAITSILFVMTPVLKILPADIKVWVLRLPT